MRNTVETRHNYFEEDEHFSLRLGRRSGGLILFDGREINGSII
jgi:hypothetical protein